MPDGTDIFAVSEVAPQSTGTTLASGEQPQNLLDMPPAAAAKRLIEEWDATHKFVKSLIEQWKVNVARAKGYAGVKLIKQQDEQRAHIPLTSSPNMSAMNQAARLKRRVRSFLFADPPLPECTPGSDEDEDRDAAELGTRILQDVCSEGNLSYALKAADAFDTGSDYGSGFIRFWVDEHGGGWRPKQVLAPRFAPSLAHREVNPMTGQPWPGEPILRYVRRDGSLTDDRNDREIVQDWLPAIRDEELTGHHIRFIPSTARDIWDAEGVRIGAMVPLGTVKRMFPQVAALTDERLAALVAARPADVKELLPRGRKSPESDIKDESLVFLLSCYYKQCADYPRGAYLVAAGDGMLLYRDEWWDAEHGEALDIPVTQFGQFRERDNPYFVGLMEFLGPGNELRAFLFGVILEHLEKFTTRKTFLPIHSNLQPEQMQSPTMTVLPIIPGGEPKYEELPDIPAVVEKMWQALKEDLDDESGLQQAGQGLNPPGVKSGVHADRIVEQVVQALSDLRQNGERGLVRGWRIMLQLIRAQFTVAQQVRWKGEDGAYVVQDYSGADLAGTRDVRINRGSFTQLAPSAKAELAQQLFAVRDPTTGEALLSLDELRGIVAGNVGGLIGVQDNPHILRVRRQISRWRKGPPKEWQPPEATKDPATGQAVPVGPDPILADIWQPIAVDAQPDVARLRAYELGRAMASTRFSRWQPEWQLGLAQEYERMRRAAGIVTVEDQQAQAQQQQAQAVASQQAEQQVALQARQQAQEEQARAAQLAGEEVERAVQAVLAQTAQGQQALAEQQQTLLAAHRTELVAALEQLAAALKPPAPVPPAPMTVNVPGTEEQAAQVAALERAVGGVQQAIESITQLAASIGGAVEALAKRPTEFVIVHDKKGRSAGIKPGTPEGRSQ